MSKISNYASRGQIKEEYQDIEVDELREKLEENENSAVEKFRCNGNLLVLKNTQNVLTITITISMSRELNKLVENLPANVDNLVLDFSKLNFRGGNVDCLDNIFTNLPINLKMLKFIYPKRFSEKISNEYGYFNLLFNVKTPLNCKFMLLIDEYTYDITYLKSNVLILNSENFSSTINFNNPHEIKQTQIILEYNSQKKIESSGSMNGGLMQLVAYGAQDVYLTDNY